MVKGQTTPRNNSPPLNIDSTVVKPRHESQNEIETEGEKEQYNTIQYSTLQYNTIQFKMVLIDFPYTVDDGTYKKQTNNNELYKVLIMIVFVFDRFIQLGLM
jgi:hypothetical protein